MATPITIGSAGGEYMEAVVILEWAAAPGDPVREGDVIVTVETAKAATEIEAPCGGVLSAVFAEPGAEVPVSEVLGLIGTDVTDTRFDAPPDPDGAAIPTTDDRQPVGRVDLAPVTEPVKFAPTSVRILASPAARIFAREANIDLSQFRPTSPTGRIKLRDLAQALPVTAPACLETLSFTDDHGPLRIHSSGTDTGTPVFLIHGFGSDAMSWFPVERTLARKHPVFGLDLPNHGASPKRRITGFPRLAREVVEAFDALDLDSVHIVGHSLGGACALALADVRPRRVASLSLIAPAGLGPVIDAGFIKGLAAASRPESLEQWLKHMVADRRIIDQAFVHAAMASRSDPALRAAQQAMAETIFPDGTQGFDLTAALERLTCPARVICGKADRIIKWRDALRAPGHVGLHFLPGIGHVPQLEATELTLQILQSHFRSV